MLERAEDALEKIVSRCTLSELLWIVRNVSYDQVSYYSIDHKGIVYNGSYSNKQIEQANDIQRYLSTYCDLFGQIIVNHNTFNDGYIDKYIHSSMIISNQENLINELETKIKELKAEIEELESER